MVNPICMARASQSSGAPIREADLLRASQVVAWDRVCKRHWGAPGEPILGALAGEPELGYKGGTGSQVKTIPDGGKRTC